MFHGNWFMQDGYFGDHLLNNSIVMCLCIAQSLCAIVLRKGFVNKKAFHVMKESALGFC